MTKLIMSLLTLTYQYDVMYEGTKTGLPIFDGSAAKFHDWEFRTQVKYKAAKKEDQAKVMADIIEGLRGDASDIAKDIGVDKLLAEKGLELLTEALRADIFPKKEAEAKLLYKQGHKKNGVLSRQASEPVVNYISRRKRWYLQLRKLDSSIELGESIRGDLLLDCSNLGKTEKLLILTSCNNTRTFDAIAKAMLDQHALIHLEERAQKSSHSYRRPDNGRGRGRFKGSDRSRKYGQQRKSFHAMMDGTDLTDSDGSSSSGDRGNDALTGDDAYEAHESEVSDTRQAYVGDRETRRYRDFAGIRIIDPPLVGALFGTWVTAVIGGHCTRCGVGHWTSGLYF